MPDSSAWIDLFNLQAEDLQENILKQLIDNDYALYLCPVVFQEVLQGVKDDKKFARMKYVLQHYKMVENDIMDVTRYAIDLYRHLRRKGITIRKSADCLIASYAIINGMYIVHNDIDFTQIAKESDLLIYK